MVARRDLLGGGILGGLLGGLGRDAAEAGEQAAQRQPQQQQIEDFSQVVNAIDKLRQEIASERAFTEIAAVRDAQKTFLRANQRLPNFVEVGTGHWFNAYDWHVRWQQPLNLGRDPLGRYTILFMGTTLIMRTDMPENFMSLPFDER